jgi:ATP-dependent DNA helicase PIF1
MSNDEFDLAEQFALYTRKHCFITGKAGTGKTTLLKRIVEKTQKNVIVVAPTGVAAINAGGVTIHSMFGLPLTCFVPTDDFVDLNAATNRQRLLHEHIHFRKDKLRMFREMEMLIIDEVSMVRCDILDAIDFVLRTVRRNAQPFGNVQVLLFGDMHQLPPVVRDQEATILRKYYRSRYFFDSLVWPQLAAAEIELQTVYRQSDAQFLDLLNNIRNRRMTEADHALLSTRYDPGFKAGQEGYVLLATHNSGADRVNGSELQKLPGKTCQFEAIIEGEFPESMYPCDSVLHLKAGSQVMFVRNDTEDDAYYNGKLAVIKRIDPENIIVTFKDGGGDYSMHRETWENIDYRLDPDTGEIIKNELGTFSQYPLRLAWAITIHKSQGLTFDKVIIDAGKSFASGQVYVALSRCRSLEGIVLHSLIPPSVLYKDVRIGEFSAAHHASEELQKAYLLEKALYANQLLLRLFAFDDLSANLEDWKELIAKKDFPEKEAAIALHAQLEPRIQEIKNVAGKFQPQLQQLILSMEGSQAQVALVKERCHKAIEYFADQIADQLIAPVQTHINELAYKKKMKRYLKEVQRIKDFWWNKVERLYQGQFLDERLYRGEIKHQKDKIVHVKSSATASKKEKSDTFTDTLDLFRQGKTVEEIASIRNLTIGTIKQHLARWVATGELDVYSVLSKEMIDAVLAYIEETRELALGAIRHGLGDVFDYNDIRMIVSHAIRLRQDK